YLQQPGKPSYASSSPATFSVSYPEAAIALWIAIASVFVSSKDTSIFFLSTSQLALATPSTPLAAFSIVFLHIPQFPLTPKDRSVIAISFDISVVVVSVSFLVSFLQLVKPNAAITATLKITFLLTSITFLFLCS